MDTLMWEAYFCIGNQSSFDVYYLDIKDLFISRKTIYNVYLPPKVSEFDIQGTSLTRPSTSARCPSLVTWRHEISINYFLHCHIKYIPHVDFDESKNIFSYQGMFTLFHDIVRTNWGIIMREFSYRYMVNRKDRL